MKYNTRIAPSPTGFMHIGTARTAYFNYLASKASGGKFYVRIDDTDQNRNDQAAIQVIHDSINWLNLVPDAVFSQSKAHSDGLYTNAANALIDAGLAYVDNGAIRLRLPLDMPTSWDDSIAGKVAITDNDKKIIDGQVIIKGDGWPTYHFATVIDDATWDINYIISGTDHIPNTARHIAIYLQMQKVADVTKYAIPKYAHVGLIHKNKKKMSKRDKEADPTVLLSYYQDNNYNPDAVLNFLARLGWGPKVDDKTTAILTKDNMISLFLDGGTMKSSPANFDMDKLNSFDRKYKARQ